MKKCVHIVQFSLLFLGARLPVGSMQHRKACTLVQPGDFDKRGYRGEKVEGREFDSRTLEVIPLVNQVELWEN